MEGTDSVLNDQNNANLILAHGFKCRDECPEGNGQQCEIDPDEGSSLGNSQIE